MSKPKKILIIGPSWVGDMVMAQVLLTLLKQRYASCIDVLAPAWTQALLARMPEVNHALVSPFQHGQWRFFQRYGLGKKLRAAHYDQAIILPNSLKSAFIPFWANIPQRTAWCGEWPRRWLLTDVRTLDKVKLPLMIQRFASLGLPDKESLPEQLPSPRLKVLASSVDATVKKYAIQRNNRPILALAPGAEFGPSKRWPAAYFAKVALAKLQQGWQVWLFGSPNDKPIAAEILQALADVAVPHLPLDLIGKTTLAEAVDLLSLATVVVSNDSGLMHIAGALELPVVALYGSTSTAFTPPLGKKTMTLNLHLDCSPCFKRTCPLKHGRCLSDLFPQQVLNALDRMMDTS